MGKVLQVGLVRVIACLAALSVAPCVMAQLAPATRGDADRRPHPPASAPAQPETKDDQGDDQRDDQRAARVRVRSGRSAVRLGGGLVAAVGGLAGRAAMKRKAKHTDGKARGRAVQSNVPPGSTRFR